jgi:cell division protein DivIC
MKKKKIIFWLLVFFFFGSFFLREQYILYKLDKVQKTYQAQLDKIKKQNQSLLNEVKLSNRSDYIENLAREKLGLAKPGEIIFIDKNKKK